MSSESGAWDTLGPCRWAYQTASFDPAEPPLIPRLVDALLGDGAVWPVPGLWLEGRRARLLQHPQAHAPGWRPDTRHWSIQVRRRLPLVVYFWELAHELAEYLLTIVEPYGGEDREPYANALAASLLLPEEVMRPHLGLLDLAVADELHVDPACYALRWGELTGHPVAVLSPGKVHRRGPGWGEDADVRRLAREAESPPVSGVRRVLRHELPRTPGHQERRVVLLGEAPGVGWRRAGLSWRPSERRRAHGAIDLRRSPARRERARGPDASPTPRAPSRRQTGPAGPPPASPRCS